MIDQIKTTLNENAATIVQDVLGASSLIVMLVIGLNLPLFF
ncbi:hypothetical protein [Albirhodobacter sp. R86504]|jgi:hypothetical protein